MVSKAIKYLDKARKLMETEGKEFLVVFVAKEEANSEKNEVGYEGRVFFRSTNPEVLARLVTSVGNQDKALEILLNRITKIWDAQKPKIKL